MSIKLCLFDLDGVLADSRELHYLALNKALENINPKYVIDRDEHLAKYDALPTTKKLQQLTQDKGLPAELHQEIWKQKQVYTEQFIWEKIHKDMKLIDIMESLHEDDVLIGVCSNATRNIVRLMLHKLGLLHMIDYVYSNQDVAKTKPHGQMYMKAMVEAQVNATETLIVEDSHVGRTAALNSGAHLYAVIDPHDLTSEKLYEHIDQINNKFIRPKWKGGKMNVLIPMAGAGSRFAAAGYTFPKPLIEVEGKPMIEVIVDNLNIEAQHIFIVQKEHFDKYNLKQLLSLISPDCEIIQVESLTEGAACTTLLAKELINSDVPLLIANSDQVVDWDSNAFMYAMKAPEIGGGIITFKATHPKWSFARVDEKGFVVEVAEKNPISDNATVGIYYWAHGKDYVRCAEQMIQKNIRTNGEFYVCPVYNEFIAEGGVVKNYPVKHMWGIGVPEDLQVYLNRSK